eukprot:TRINITY_DN5164_c0_g1_i7.p1 TRINITY_DN5164_c0_g1~~TRINITY_DN5164_c0_g1_i7.p1  ORF type:complete len:716 (+),score=113.90 TRINITY_DN5164_c0_g1_i7:64-2211(+)
MASINDFTPWWEYSILGVVLSAYLMLTLFALRNRWSRPKVAEKSGAMTECEQYSVDLVRHVAPSVAVQEYRFRGMHPKTSPIDIQFENLSVTLKSDGRCVLEGVTGEFKEGNMAAIMGPSGAGKTTFMNAVCGKAYYGTTEGEVRINGRTSSIAEIKELRGFVPQDDIVHEHLTVREQLYYSARLRNPERTSLREIDLIVEDVLHVMQLLDVQHSIVGSVENRGISGGQRKRVNIGLELAARPTVLMLDEPTSGLDATTAQSIIQSLKHLTTIGMTVIMVIHQPRYSLFTLFDEVLLLGVGGRTVYQGPSQGALPYFQGIGFQMAEHENPADWFMDVISAKIPNTRTHSHLESSTLADMWKNRSKQEIQQVQRTLQRQATESHVEVFERGLAETLQKLGISSEASSITADDLTALLGSAGVQNPSPGALAELKQRIGFQQDSVTKDRFLAFLCSLRGCVAHDALSESDSETAAEELHWKQTSKPSTDMRSISSAAAPEYSPVGKAMATERYQHHSHDCGRVCFWCSMQRVLAFYLARVTISLFDVLIWCYIFSAVWYLSARPGGDFWVWLMAFRLIAVSSAGWGVLISTLVPQHSSTLAVAVAILIMGGAISEPQSIAEAPGTLGEVLAFLSPFTWSSGENYLVFISRQEGGIESVSPAAMPIVNGYMHILRGGVLEKLNMSYTASAASSCAILGFLSLLLGYLGLRLSHRGKQA